MVEEDIVIILIQGVLSIALLIDLPGICECSMKIKLRRKVILQMMLECMGKILQTIKNMVGRGVSQAAMSVVLNQVAKPLYFQHINHCAAVICYFIKVIF